jgi:hypothetical protein
MAKFKDLTGQTFVRLYVIEYAGRVGTRPISAWKCRCLCGKEKVVRGADLIRGKTVSCGCYMVERIREIRTKHSESGYATTKEYATWLSIRKRCFSPQDKNWPRYGGRGITMSQEWSKSYDNFLRDMGRAPSQKHSIDRINNDGNYEKSNCRWATNKQQSNNRFGNLRIPYNGKVQTATQWAEELGLNRRMISEKFYKGIPIERILNP